MLELYLKGGDGVQNTKIQNPCSQVFTVREEHEHKQSSERKIQNNY